MRIKIYVVFLPYINVMITYIENLYVTDKTAKKTDKIKNAIDNNRQLQKGFVIILSLTSGDVFDIIPHFTIKGICDKNIDIKVLGLAESKKAAMNLCLKMSDEYLKSRFSGSMRQYFENMV